MTTINDSLSLSEAESDRHNGAKFEIINSLCEKCKQFVETIDHPLELFWHHHSFKNLERVADLGCLICKMILEHPHASFGLRVPNTKIELAVAIIPHPQERHTISCWAVQTKIHSMELELAIQPVSERSSYYSRKPLTFCQMIRSPRSGQ